MVETFDVFLSHNSKDKPLVRRIAKRLEKYGLTPWLDEKDLRPGLPFQDGLEEAMRSTRAAAVFLGGHGLGSWQRPEVRACLSLMVERGQPVIPVLLPGAPEKPEIGLFLRENTWIDFRDGISEEGISRLVWGITGEKPSRERRYPFSAAPEPRYEDDRTRELGEQLAAAQRRFKELSIDGQDVADVREQILGLRRAMRDGERLQPGNWLGDGRFQLLEIVGRGGFATVWKAWDERRLTLVAIKVLHGQHAEDRTRRERFFRGARKMAELHHPGIVRVIEAELEESGKHFFVMDYVAGGDLRRAVLAGELPREKIVPVILAMGEALAYAHEKGIIHRDVKPANILLDGERPKLTDFDLVRAFDTTGGTQTQGMLGTVLYAAPEMLSDAKSTSTAADVYSLAMTAVFTFHGKDLPPDVWRRPEAFLEKLPCPQGLRAALGRGISWEIEGRPGSVAEFCEELKRAAALAEKAPVGSRKPTPGEERLAIPAPVVGKERRKKAPIGSRELAPVEERLHKVDETVLLYVPGGEYTLGAEDIGEEEKPVHRVVLSPFWIAKYPVTNEQYGRFLGANPGTRKPEYWTDKWFNQAQHPVVGVSWEEAQAYCRWAGLWLPTEAQWEAAARGADGRRYPWGESEPTPEHANFGGREGGTTPVGTYPKGAGPFGALDQAGNVWEWCEDVWDEAAYRNRDGQRDPVSIGENPAVCCLRGGSWYLDAGNLAAAFRNRFWASDRLRIFGFRCLLPAEA